MKFAVGFDDAGWVPPNTTGAFDFHFEPRVSYDVIDIRNAVSKNIRNEPDKKIKRMVTQCILQNANIW